MAVTAMAQLYPNCAVVARSIRIGGKTKEELLEALREHGVELNEAGTILFARDEFTTSEASSVVETVEITVANLGFAEGATSDLLLARAASLGLSPCPLELAAYLRLDYRDQPEGHQGHPPTQHRAPPGSVTIVSRPIHADDTVPQGFYVRRINGVLWLRGYRAGPEHIWDPEDRLLFVVQTYSKSKRTLARPRALT
jgi:hypothetical protein